MIGKKLRIAKRPLENDDPKKPREAYFQHVDFIIKKASELGLYIGLLPTWVDKVYKQQWGSGPEIFNNEMQGFMVSGLETGIKTRRI